MTAPRGCDDGKMDGGSVALQSPSHFISQKRSSVRLRPLSAFGRRAGFVNDSFASLPTTGMGRRLPFTHHGWMTAPRLDQSSTSNILMEMKATIRSADQFAEKPLSHHQRIESKPAAIARPCTQAATMVSTMAGRRRSGVADRCHSTAAAAPLKGAESSPQIARSGCRKCHTPQASQPWASRAKPA